MKFIFLPLLLFLVLTGCNPNRSVLKGLDRDIIKLSNKMKMEAAASRNDPDKIMEISSRFQDDMIKLLDQAIAKTTGDDNKLLKLAKSVVADVKKTEKELEVEATKFEQEFKIAASAIVSKQVVDKNAQLLKEYGEAMDKYETFYKSLASQIRKDGNAIGSEGSMKGFVTGMIMGMKKKIPSILKVTQSTKSLLASYGEFNSFIGSKLNKFKVSGQDLLFEEDSDVDKYNALMSKMQKEAATLEKVSQALIQQAIQ